MRSLPQTFAALIAWIHGILLTSNGFALCLKRWHQFGGSGSVASAESAGLENSSIFHGVDERDAAIRKLVAAREQRC